MKIIDFIKTEKSKKCYCITTTTTTSTTTYYYYYIENVPLCKKQRSLCVLSWCLNTTTITRDSILFMMGTLNNTKLVFFQKENITKKVILIISRVDEWRRRRKVWTTRKCWINSEERPFLLKGVATKWVWPQAHSLTEKKIITKKKTTTHHSVQQKTTYYRKDYYYYYHDFTFKV